MKLYLLLTTGLLAGLMTGAVRADESNATHLKFSDATKPGTLKVNLEGGDLKIVGSSDATDITVISDAKASSQKRSDGLRVLSASTSFELTEKDNVATLQAGYGRRHGSSNSYKITVPKNTAVIINNLYGDTNCSGLGGDVDVRSSNGAVTLKEVEAGASVETMNGVIKVTVKKLLPAHALSFSSMNGEIVLHLPEEAKANLRLRTQNGSILTDYDDKELTATSTSGNDSAGSAEDSQSQIRDAMRQAADATREAAREAREAVREGLGDSGGHAPAAPVRPLPPLPPMTGGQIVSGVLHGGGTDVQAATMNGDVTVRKN